MKGYNKLLNLATNETKPLVHFYKRKTEPQELMAKYCCLEVSGGYGHKLLQVFQLLLGFRSQKFLKNTCIQLILNFKQ